MNNTDEISKAGQYSTVVSDVSAGPSILKNIAIIKRSTITKRIRHPMRNLSK